MSRRPLLLLVLVLSLGALPAAPALASEQRPTQTELEAEIICPTCHTTLDQSNSPIAARMKAYIRTRIGQGARKSAIENELVGQFGRSVLADPAKKGFDLLAWLLPLVGAVAGALVIGFLVWRWSRHREGAAGAPALAGPALDPELERRLDEELRRVDA